MMLTLVLAALRIQSHLLVGDPASAVAESRMAFEQQPDSSEAMKRHIQTLAAAGNEAEMIEIWGQLHQKFPEEAFGQELIESICWGVLRKGEQASSLSTQLIALLGAGLSQDAYAVKTLQNGMRHSNAFLRQVAAELAGLYGDQALKEEIARLFREEKVAEVRQTILASIGKLRMNELIPDLMRLVNHKKSTPEEKRGAVKAIALSLERLGHDELKELVKSPRAFLRLLACESIARLELREEGGLLIPLIDDAHPEVRQAALQAMGILRLDLHPRVEKAIRARDPSVGISAAWVTLLSDKDKGEAAFHYWFQHGRSRARSLAAGAIAASGGYGVDIARREIEQTEDPYVRVNLALALLARRVDVEKSAKILDDFLRDHPEKLMEGEGIFSPIQPSTLTHNAAVPNLPEVMNQKLRLEMLNLLAIVEYPEAQEALKRFLKKRKWGVTGLAAEAILGEGDESGVDLVRELLDDPDSEIRAEAALVLAVWGRDRSVLQVLMELYPKADRSLQIKLLEALGRIGDREAMPFLLERLKEPSQTLRIIAAAVLLQTINH